MLELLLGVAEGMKDSWLCVWVDGSVVLLPHWHEKGALLFERGAMSLAQH